MKTKGRHTLASLSFVQAIELSSKKEIVTHYILQKELFVEHWNGGQYHCGINVVLIPSLEI